MNTRFSFDEGEITMGRSALTSHSGKRQRNSSEEFHGAIRLIVEVEADGDRCEIMIVPEYASRLLEYNSKLQNSDPSH
jgi:hypothetical protein